MDLCFLVVLHWVVVAVLPLLLLGLFFHLPFLHKKLLLLQLLLLLLLHLLLQLLVLNLIVVIGLSRFRHSSLLNLHPLALAILRDQNFHSVLLFESGRLLRVLSCHLVKSITKIKITLV
jgi:hypothetical protein